MHEDNKPASCEATQQLAKKSLKLIDLFTGGDPKIKQSLDNMYSAEGSDKVLNQRGMDVDKTLFSYVSDAIKIAKNF